MIGTQLGPYRIERELGRGGMGTVWRAVLTENEGDLREGTAVALKVVRPHLLETPGFFKRFLREAQLGQAIDHPNVVRAYDCDAVMVDGTSHHFLAMEFVDGQTLRQLFDEWGRIPEELCRHIAHEVLSGLEAIHAAGVVHRDLKPENVLITDDSPQVVKIMDLGVARLQDEVMRLTKTGHFAGSIEYAAPEQLAARTDELDGRVDLHALGVMLYEFAAGTHPFFADDPRSVMRRIFEEVPRKPHEIAQQLTPFFGELIAKLLQKNPERRFGSAAEVREILAAGEQAQWWQTVARELRSSADRPLRRPIIDRETEIYGREKELSTLRDAYERAKGGHGQIVFVRGEAGIGKTRLMDEFISRLAEANESAHFLFGSYPPGGAATASGAFCTAYREFFGGDDLEEQLAPLLPTLPLLVPSFAALLQGSPTPPGAEKLTSESLQTVFARTTQALSMDRPTILLVDDLHFAPMEGRALFLALAHAIRDHAILLVGTLRRGTGEDWAALCAHEFNATQLHLERLGAKDLANMLRDAFSSERLAEELSYRVATKSDGNPFFVLEILRSIRESGLLSQAADGTWVRTQEIRELEIPSSILDFVRARILELAEDEKDLLDVAACYGFEFDPLVVGEVVDMARIPLLKKLARLEAKLRIVRSAGERFTFDHHQVQEALYRGMPRLLAREYHAAIAASLSNQVAESPAPHGDLLVRACRQAYLGRKPELAAPHLDAALDHLEQNGLNEKAVQILELALEQTPATEPERRVELLLHLASRFDLMGRRKRQREIAQDAIAVSEQAGSKALYARSQNAMANCLRRMSELDAAAEAYERAHAAAAEIDDPSIRASALGGLGLVWHIRGEYERAQAALEESLALVRSQGNASAEAVSQSNLGLVYARLGRLSDARRCHEAVLEIAKRTGARRVEATAHGNLGNLCFDVGDIPAAIEHQLQLLEIAEQIGDREGVARAQASLGGAFLHIGRLAESREKYRACLRTSLDIGYRIGEAIAYRGLGEIALQLGLVERARERIQQGAQVAEAIGFLRLEGATHAALADIAYIDGDDDAALAASQKAGALFERAGSQDEEAARAVLARARALHRMGREGEARQTLEDLLAWPTIEDVPAGGAVARAQLARIDPAQADTARAALEASGGEMTVAERLEAAHLIAQVTGDAALRKEAQAAHACLRDNRPSGVPQDWWRKLPIHREIAETLP